MSIKSSVGAKGVNDKVDARVIQAALNLSQSGSFKLATNLVVDGDAGTKTVEAIALFQLKVVGMAKQDGRVDPAGKTLGILKARLSKGLTEDALLAIMAYGHPTVVKPYLPLLKIQPNAYQVNTPLRLAHFCAQIGHESLSLTYTEEIASGAAYEGRKDLGNTQKGDGIRFKGRGLIQLTGRQNYSDYGDYAGLDLLKAGNEILIAITPSYALDVALWFWQKRNLNSFADRDDLRSITRRVNGGYNGLPERQAYLDRAKFFLLP